MKLDDHIRLCSKYQFDKRRNASEAVRRIKKVYPDTPEASLSTSTAYEWFSKFAAGDRNLQDELRSGSPSRIGDSTMKVILKADPHQTTTDLQENLGVTEQLLLTTCMRWEW